MDFSENRGIKRTRLVGIAILLLLPLTVDALEDESLQLEPPKAVRGQKVTITIRTDLPWSDEVRIDYPQFEESIVWWSYPYAMPWGRIDDDGSISRLIQVRAAIRVDEIGFHTIEPFSIQSGENEFITDVKNLVCVEVDEKNLPYPIVLRWRNLPEVIWQGQTVLLSLEARNFPFLAFAESSKLNQVPVGLLEDIPDYGQIITRSYENDILYDVPVASWLWTLSEPGTYSFPGAEVVINGLVRSIQGFSLTVRELPAPANEYGAIGDFRLDAGWEDRQYSIGEIVTIRVRVEGVGNLSVLRTPIPKFPGAELVSSGSQSSIFPDISGYRGWREDHYDYRINAAGELGMILPEWTWFNPQQPDQFQGAEKRTYTIQSRDVSSETVVNAADLLLGIEMFRYRASVFHAQRLQWYLLLLPSFLMMLFFPYLKKNRQFFALGAGVFILMAAAANDVSNAETAAEARNSAQSGEWDKADQSMDVLREKYGNSPGFLHDRAIIAMEKNQPDAAVKLIRQSLYLRPGDKRLMRTLEFMEDRLGLSDQVSPPLKWPPSLAFAVWLIIVHAVFAVVTMLLFKREAREYILLVSVSILFAAATSFLIYTHTLWNREIGIVNSQSQVLRRIPVPLAPEWMKLPVGTAVEVIAVENLNCLVRTSYGLEGWLALESINLVNEGINGFR